MEYREYIEKMSNLDSLEMRVRNLGGIYKTYQDGFLDIIRQLRELYDNDLIESGAYPTI